MMPDFTSFLCSVESTTWDTLFVMALLKLLELVTFSLHEVSAVVLFPVQIQREDKSSFLYTLAASWSLTLPLLWSGQRNIHSTLLYLLGQKLKIVRRCPSRAKDKAQVSFLVTEEWNEIKWNCTSGWIMFLVTCLSTTVAFLIIIRENQAWFHSRRTETLTVWNDRMCSPPSFQCHLFLSCHLHVMSTQYKKVYKNTRKS